MRWLWGSDNRGRRHIKFTTFSTLFITKLLMKLAFLLTATPISFTPNGGLPMPTGNSLSRSFLPSHEGQKSSIFLIFSWRPNFGPTTLMMSNSLATSESPISLPSLRYHAWRRSLQISLILWRACAFWPSLSVPSYLDYGNSTLLKSLDLSIHDFDWLFDKVQFRVNLNFVEQND